MKYIIAVDLEGAHGIVGEPYKGLLVDIADYKKAVENVTKEVNMAIKALYDSGATEVDVWDNHGNLDNAEGLAVEYGEDAHVLTASVGNINELRMFL